MAGNCFCCLWLANVFVGWLIAAEKSLRRSLPERAGGIGTGKHRLVLVILIIMMLGEHRARRTARLPNDEQSPSRLSQRMHVRLWPRVSWESTPGHGGPQAGGCRNGGTGPEASHDVTAASSELAMITSSRGSPKRLGFSEKCLEPQLLRTTTECCCLCGCMVLVLLVLAMLQLYSFMFCVAMSHSEKLPTNLP